MDSSSDKSSSNSRVLEATQDFLLDLTMSRSQISFDHDNSPNCVDQMPSKSLDDLPDLCLLAVFKRISLIELLRNVRLVNTRLCQLMPTELKRRRSLVIVDDRYFNLSDLKLDQYQSGLIEHVRRDDGLTPWSRLLSIDYMNLLDRNTRYPDNYVDNDNPMHNQVPPEMITTLVNSLPRIRSLTVVQRFSDLSALDQISRMIDHWRGELVSLKLYLHYEISLLYNSGRIPADDHKAQLKARTLALFDSINRATSLKHLKLKLDYFYLIDTPFKPPLTILSYLNTFDVRFGLLEQHLGESLVSYAPTNRDLQIALGESSLQHLLGFNREFCDKFIDVKLQGIRSLNVEDMNRFCTRFSSLVHLFVIIHDIPVTRFAKSLSSLTQLVHLSIHCAARDGFFFVPEYQELRRDQIVPVPSVRLLTLTLFIRSSHTTTRQLRLHEVFPNVQVLNLECVTVDCLACGFNVNLMNGQFTENAPLLRQCAQLARRPFRRFPRLHTVQIDAQDSIFVSPFNEKILITREEL